MLTGLNVKQFELENGGERHGMRLNTNVMWTFDFLLLFK